MPQEQAKPHWSVYLLRCADQSLYCGVTTDLERRLAEHNGLRKGGARYTKSRRPVSLALHLDDLSQGEALKIEAHIKRLKKDQKLSTLEALKKSLPKT
ncbi:MAG: GIY-YIG nuclease family protein [Desulfovibrio sp.]|nr:GIY-YIG nuclease family protein [Desulfovibrio sp.]